MIIRIHLLSQILLWVFIYISEYSDSQFHPCGWRAFHWTVRGHSCCLMVAISKLTPLWRVRIGGLKGFQISFEDPKLVYLVSFEMNRQQTYRGSSSNYLGWVRKYLDLVPPFPPRRVLGVQWSRAISLMCEVTLRNQVQSLERYANTTTYMGI